MMTEKTQSDEWIRIGDQLIHFDRDGTKSAYSQMETPGAEECGCVFCRNYIAQRNDIYPASFLSLLERLGIDSGKEGEVYYLAPNERGKRLYGGWFFFCGEMIEPSEKQVSQDGVSYSVLGPGRMPSPHPRDRFGSSPLAIDFSIEIPWVLPAAEDPDDQSIYERKR